MPKPKKEEPVRLNLTETMTLNKELSEMNKEDAIDFVIKFQLVKLYEKTRLVVKLFEETRIELFKKYGKELENGQFTLEDSPKKEEGMEELKKLMATEESFSFQFKLSDFKRLKSTKSYIEIMKFMKE